MIYHGVVISDIHFGATDPERLTYELRQNFLHYIKNMNQLHFIIIDGDYFDHKIYLNDRTSDYALSFMDQLVEVAREFKCPIRIVYGTESHEVSQYNIFSMYETDTDLDFKIIYSVSEEELLKNMMVLYIPEEYISNKKEYYKEFLDDRKRYNYIFGHGTIQDIMVQASKHVTGKDSERKKVPIFTASELMNSCKGQVYFGHYHVNSSIEDKIFYVGSYSRWIFGEEEPKGFYHITYDTKKEKYTQEFIENLDAKKYITYTYSYSSKVIESEDNLIDELSKKDKLTEINDGDHVRYIFNIPEDHPNPEFIMNILNERYRYNTNVSVKVTNGYVDQKKKASKDKLSNAKAEYPLIFDKSAKLEDQVQYFIKKKTEREIPIDRIKLHLYGNGLPEEE